VREALRREHGKRARLKKAAREGLLSISVRERVIAQKVFVTL
jgi:hypothetical protein